MFGDKTGLLLIFRLVKLFGFLFPWYKKETSKKGIALDTSGKKFLYLVETEDMCKIGVTDNVLKRVKSYLGFRKGLYWETRMACSIEHIITREFACQKKSYGREYFELSAYRWIPGLVSTVLKNAHSDAQACEILFPSKRPRGRPRGKKVRPN